jgi:diguanylate cyclase
MMRKGQKLHFFKLFIPLSLIALVTILIICYAVTNNHIKNVVNLVQSTMNNETNIFQRTINGSIADVLFLKEEILLEYYSRHESMPNNFSGHLAQTFASFSKHSDIYDQVRFIDRRGQEKLRINNRDGQISIVPQRKLQNKKHRYYFTESILRQNSEIYFSPLDLNIEHKHIERPFRPMIRIGTPVITKKGVKLGAVILNYNAQQLLDHLKQAGRFVPGNLFVINQDGHFLLAEEPGYEWGNMLQSRKNITAEKLFPALWQKLSQKHSSKIYTKQGIFFIADVTTELSTLQHGDLNLKLIWLVPWRDLIPNAIKYYLFILTILWIAAFFVSWVWALLKVKQAEHEQELKFLATIDPLTKIANRHELLRIGTLEFDRAKRFKKAFSILMLDIDFFKKVNDTYGHLNGDKALVAVAQTSKSGIRKVDFIARFGGEEFVMILPETSIRSAEALAKKLLQKIATIKIPFKETYYSFTVSIGASIWNEHDSNIDNVIKRADDNLYKAKEGGRNRVVAEKQR